MPYEERFEIITPEGVSLELRLSGIGSRGAAASIDAIIRLAVLVVTGIAFEATTDIGGAAGVIVTALASFLLVFGYDVGFETWNRGRTPGKALVGIRVIRTSGSPVGFVASAVRNLVRIVDWLPFAYTVGMVTMTATRNNQRLGDLAGGTLVVSEPRRRAMTVPPTVTVPAGWDTSAVSSEELAAVRTFLDRRDDLDATARQHLANKLAVRLNAKVVRPPTHISPERFLEIVAATRTGRA